MTTATDRYKMLLANALEWVCVVEEELEKAQARIAELEAALGQGAGSVEATETPGPETSRLEAV